MRVCRFLLAAAALTLSLPAQQKNESPIGAANVDAGKQLYQGSCSGCHGATGEGSQGPSLLSGRVNRLADRALFETIRNGLPGTTMPDFPLAEPRIWELAAYVRSLSAPAVAVKTAGDAERGREFFLGAGKCAGCHMILGQGGVLGPDLSNVGADRTLHQLRESIAKPSARIAAGYSAAVAKMKSGRMIEGIAKNFNNYSVQILDRGGKLHLIRREELSSLDIKVNSLMPALSDPATVADLLAFLARQSIRPYESEGNVP
jgi:cytochrome c oxidase cbb3-type subunit III